MFANIRSFFKSTAIYGIAGSTRSFGEFLLLPLYARYLTPGDFGVLDILMIFVMFGMVIAVLEMNNAAFRFYYDREKLDYQRDVISTSFVTTSVNGMIVFLISFGFADNLSRMFFNTTDYAILFILAGLIVSLNSICTVPFNLMRIRNKPVLYAVLSLSLVSFSIGGIVILLSKYKMGVEGILLGKALAFVPIAIISLLAARSYIRLNINFPLVKSMLKYSLPLIPVGMAIWGINGLNRLFMLGYLSTEQIGYFSLASKFAVIITLGVIAFQLAWPQFAFSNMNFKSASEKFSQIFNISIALGLWLVVFITLFSGDFINLAMNREFYPATGAVLPLALGMFFYGVFYFFTTGAVIKKQTLTVLVPIILAAAINIALNVIVTPVYGFKGTAWVTLSSYLVMAMTMYFLVRDSGYIELDFARITKLTLLSSIYIPVSAYLAYENTPGYIIIKTAVFLSFPLTLRLVGYISKSHIAAVKEMIKRKTNVKVRMIKKSETTNVADITDIKVAAVQDKNKVSV